MTTPLDLLGRTPYVRLTTFRKDGTPVPTPVWVVPVGDELLVWTNPTAGKVKRIRRDGHVEIGPCTRRGQPIGGSIPAFARILAPDELDVIEPALIRKYGALARMTFLPAKINRWLRRPARPIGGLALSLPSEPGDSLV